MIKLIPGRYYADCRLYSGKVLNYYQVVSVEATEIVIRWVGECWLGVYHPTSFAYDRPATDEEVADAILSSEVESHG